MRARKLGLITLIFAIVIGPFLILGTGIYVLVSHEKVSLPIGGYVLEAYRTHQSDGMDVVTVTMDKTVEQLLSKCPPAPPGELDIISTPFFWLGPVEYRLWQCMH